jgi:hypothetical protein
MQVKILHLNPVTYDPLLIIYSTMGKKCPCYILKLIENNYFWGEILLQLQAVRPFEAFTVDSLCLLICRFQWPKLIG